jgi:hypothetical protein
MSGGSSQPTDKGRIETLLQYKNAVIHGVGMS